MALNEKIALYRGVEANLAALASTGQAGVLALATDTNALYVDQGSGTAGIGNPGSGKAWIRSAAGTQVFSVASQTAQVALSGAMTGDIAIRTDTNTTYMLTGQGASAYATFGNWVAIGSSASFAISGGSAVTNEFVSAISSTGAVTLSQPSFANLSGLLTAAQLPTTIDCGTF